MVIMGAVTLAACGSSVSSGGSGSGTAGPTASAASATGLLAKVEQSHKLSIAMSAFAPQDFQASDGSWTGYDVGILRGFAKSLGASLVINPMPFAASIEAVATRRDDVSIDIYYTAQRAKQVAFSRPMLNYNDAIAVNSANPKVTSDTISALTGKNVAVVVGSAEVAEANKIPHATVTKYSNISESFLALSSGRVAADVQPDVDISWAKHKNPSLKIKLLGPVPSSLAPPIASLRGYYAVPKGSYGSEFLAKLNTYLKTIACNGSEQKILNNFSMSNPIYLKGICTASNVYSG